MELLIVPLRELSVELKQLYGSIWFETNGLALPERGWTERPLHTMGIWTGGLRNILEVGRDSLHFFEGHFGVQLYLKNRDLRVQFYDQEDEIVAEEYMAWSDFVAGLLGPLCGFNSELKRKGLEEYVDETQELIVLLDELKRALD